MWISPTLGKKQITKLHAHATTSCSHTPTHTHRLTGVDPKVGRPRHAEYNWRELKREVDFVRSKMTSIVANVHQSGKMEGDADKIADEVWDSFIAYSKNGIVEDARPGYFYGWMLMKGEMPALLNRGIPSSTTPTTTTSTSKATQAEALHSLTAVLVRDSEQARERAKQHEKRAAEHEKRAAEQHDEWRRRKTEEEHEKKRKTRESLKNRKFEVGMRLRDVLKDLGEEKEGESRELLQDMANDLRAEVKEIDQELQALQP